MPRKDTPQNVIESYRKRQKTMPILVGGMAVLLIIIGIIIIVVWLAGPNKPQLALFPSVTPTVTLTFTETPEPPTYTPTMPPTETLVPTITETPTISGPFEYQVQEKDNCWDLSLKFNVELAVLLAINNFNGCPIKPGDKILIPAPGQQLPTETPLPADLPRGTKVEYTIKQNDTLALIASKFNTTVDTLLKDNKIDANNANNIKVGDKLTVRVNLVTPTKTLGPTSTPGTPQPPTPTATFVSIVTIIPPSSTPGQ